MEGMVFTREPEDNCELEAKTLARWCALRDKGDLCDTVIRTDDGGTFYVHRTILAQCSRYFQALFTINLGRKNRSRFTIPGLTRPMMQEIVHHAYSMETRVDDLNAAQLLPAADQFSVLRMLRHCTEFLIGKLGKDNCIGFRNFAAIYFCKDLENAADRFLRAHLTEVSESSEEYLALEPGELLELLNSDRINVRGEEQVWEAALRWVEHRPLDRAKFMPALMRCVRLGLLESPYFMDSVKQNKYVMNNEACKPIVIETMKFIWDLEMIGQRTEAVDTPFLATPRIPHSILFTIGGWSGGSPTNLIETYDTKADRWIKVPETSERPRAYHKLAVLGEEIFVVGGFDGNEYFNSCTAFHTVHRTWRNVAPMHCRRCYVSVATLGDKMYAMGGYDGHYRQNTVERYDHLRNQWTLVNPMNTQRSDACATTLDGRIFIVGGFNGTECLSSGESYDPLTDQWTTIASMRQRRSGVSVIAHRRHLYALGGFNGISRLTTGERYDPETEQWSSIPDMFNPRSNFAIEVIDDMIFVIGGFNGVTTIFHVECFDPRHSEWLEATDMNAYRSALSACVVHGLKDPSPYVHPNRGGLMEEKRQKMRQQAAAEEARRQFDPIRTQGGEEAQEEAEEEVDEVMEVEDVNMV